MTLYQRTSAFCAIAILLSGCGTRLFAGDDPGARQTLKEIKGVNVFIEPLGPASDGLLTVEQLRTDVQLRLRSAGVKILDPGSATLYINANIMTAPAPITGLYAFNCKVSLMQTVFVPINSVTTTLGTWSLESLGMVGRDNLSRVFRETLSDQVDKFLNAYLSVNPKP